VSWNALTTGTVTNLNSIHFPTVDIGYAAGSSGMLLKTSDAGEQWIVQQKVTNQHLNSICFVNNDTGFAAGDRGAMLKTTNGGIVAIEELQDSFQLYPNPGNGIFKIKTDQNFQGSFTVFVTDLAGHPVFQKQFSGIKEIAIDLTGVRAGCYVMQLKSPDRSLSTRLLVIL
ncbi:MAG TPA: T9SS type A sorting domain-containing protein, partial [Bacteroidales bacterium]|nr:T9SS type A sorting domain-containing protein [Bacteroidales bacterium]